MAWQQYIDSNLIGSGHMHSAAIVSLADSSYWAYGGSTVPQPEEVAHIVACLKEPSLAQEKGITIGGQKYFTLRAEANTIYIKLGSGGACIAGGNQCAIIGVYGEGVAPPACNMAVEGIRDYLGGQGY